jgi:hypothetical protein
MSDTRTVTELVAHERYWMVGEYDNIPTMSVCLLYGDADAPETCGGDKFGNVYVVVEGREGDWEASGYVKRKDLASTEELLAALEAYRPSVEVRNVYVTSASDGAVAACAILADARRPQISVVRDRDVTPSAMTVDRIMLREELRQVCRQAKPPGLSLMAHFVAGGDLADHDEFEILKRELSQSLGRPMEIDEWMVR